MSSETRPLLAGNWKLNPVRLFDAVDLARGVRDAARPYLDRVEVALFPPFTWLYPVAHFLEETGIETGAQDCYWEASGAYTGEVSAEMLSGWCQWVIVGHSERRQYFAETDETVCRKAAAALAAGLKTVVCVGERAEQLDAGQTEAVVEGQVRAALRGLEVPAVASRLVIAYEPVWAIGTGRNADPAHAGATMDLVKRVVREQDAEVRVLYGGSVKAANVRPYLELAACDGCLVGGASLNASEFSKMVATAAELPG